MGCFCGCCARATLIVVGIVSFIIGIVDIALPAYKIVEAPKDFKEYPTYRLSGEVTSPDLSLNFYDFSLYAYYVIIGGGAGLLILSLLAIISTCKTNRCCLGITAVLTQLLVGGSITALVFYTLWYDSYRGNITLSLQESIKLRYNVSSHEEITEAWNTFMEDQSCCGGAGPQDFIERIGPNVTNSVNVDELTCRADIRYPRPGCDKKLRIYEIDATNTLQLIMFSLQLSFSVLLALFTICACCNTKDKKASRHETDSYDTDKKRHR